MIRKGIAVINSAGNNAYFVKRELLNDEVREVSVVQAYLEPLFRESRDRGGRLAHLDLAGRKAAIRGMPVFNVENGQIESF